MMEKQTNTIDEEVLKKIVTNSMIVYYNVCEYCKKDIIGRSIPQYKKNMERHIEKCKKEKLIK